MKFRSALFLAALFCVGLAVVAQDESPSKREKKGRGAGEKTYVFKTDVPDRTFDLILSRPTDRSVTASLLFARDGESFFEYGTESGKWTNRTPALPCPAGEPATLCLSNLSPDTRYFYQLHYRTNSGEWAKGEIRSFHTQRKKGQPFTFTIQADSHLDGNTDPAVYLRTLSNALADAPDFHIDLGDTFMGDKHKDRESALRQYLAQRYYFGQIAPSAPLFLVLGNHDGEAARWADGTTNSLGVWSNHQRKRFFPNPVPDSFYTGNDHPFPNAGLLEDYYAWEWGDALFVVLDPFWFTPSKKGAGGSWTATLGKKQYDWLAQTLAASQASYRFVFIHHLVGGSGKDSRGGSEAAPYFEWGGKNADGTEGFGANRPGWLSPIHDLLVKHRVNAVFHGHDHFFAHQERDGIAYQLLPQPGHPRGEPRSAEEYGYTQGTILPGSGHLRVKVDSEKVSVDFIRSTGTDAPALAHHYELKPR